MEGRKSLFSFLLRHDTNPILPNSPSCMHDIKRSVIIIQLCQCYIVYSDMSSKSKAASLEPAVTHLTDDVSDYETIRNQNIKRNSDFLERIGIDSVKPSLPTTSSKSRTSTRGISAGNKKVPALPTRRSGRVTLERVKAEIDEAKNAGDETLLEEKRALLANLQVKKEDASYNHLISQAVVPEKLSTGPISMLALSGYVPEEGDEGKEDTRGLMLVDCLRAIDSSSCRSVSQYNEDNDHYRTKMASLTQSSGDIAKVVPSRITSMVFHPSDSRTLVCAGDKFGNVGIWDAISVDSDDRIGKVTAATGGDDGVYLFKLHTSNVCALHVVQQEPQRLWSVSYDGSVRCADVEHCQFVCAHSSEDNGYTMAAFDTGGGGGGVNTILASTFSGAVCCIDRRSGNVQWTNSVNIDSKQKSYKVNTVQVHPTNEHVIVTAGANGHLGVYDLRQRGTNSWKPLCLHSGHHNSVTGAQVSPDGKLLVSVGYDNTVKLWSDFMSPSKMQCKSYRHDNQTGRWLSTFRPVFDPKHPHAFLLGSLSKPRCMELHVASRTSITAATMTERNKKRKNPTEECTSFQLDPCTRLMGGDLQSVCSRFCIHPSRDVLAGGNSSGKVYLFR